MSLHSFTPPTPETADVLARNFKVGDAATTNASRNESRYEVALRLAQELEALISSPDEGEPVPAPAPLRFARALTRSLIDELSSLPRRT